MRFIAVLISIIGLACNNQKTHFATTLEGKPMPDFNLLLVDSTTYLNTNAIPMGKPIVLFYFGPYCPYSRAQMEEIIKNINKLKDIRFYIFTIYPFQELKEFYSHYELYKYSNIKAGIDYTNSFGHYFGVHGVPYTAVYGKNKILKQVFAGETYSNEIKHVCEE